MHTQGKVVLRISLNSADKEYPTQSSIMVAINSMISIYLYIIYRVFFYWSALKMAKYKEKLKYLNWSAKGRGQLKKKTFSFGHCPNYLNPPPP